MLFLNFKFSIIFIFFTNILFSQNKLLTYEELKESKQYFSIADAIDFENEVFVLNLENKKIVNISKIVFLYFKNLQWLKLGKNKIKFIPKEIENLQNLQNLNLWNNQIESLPKEIGELKNLETLFLLDNKLELLPSEIGNLKYLKYLNISHNKLKEIPNEISKLKNLEKLYLYGNKITFLPNSIKNLKNLKILEIWNNKLSFSEKEKIKKLLPKTKITF